MVQVTLQGKLHTLALDFNSTVFLHRLQESRPGGQELLDIGPLLATVDDPATPISVKLRVTRMLVTAMLASENPHFEADPVAAVSLVGSWIAVTDVPAVMEAVGRISQAMTEA